MSKMILNITVTLFSALMLWNCVEDESTVGESTVNNDNTYSPLTVKAAMNDQQQKVISYFYEGANQTTGMAYNGSTSKTTLTTGATGMGIMNLVIGVERGWISREDAAEHIVKIVRFLKTADRFAGAWAHWYRPDGKILPFGNQNEAGEIVETSFMMGGLLTACEYFTGNSEAEKEIRETTNYFWETIEWNHFVNNGRLYWIWHKDTNTYELPLIGWNETLLVYILAMAAPDNHKVSTDIYKNCWQGRNFATPGRKTYGYLMPLGTEYGNALFLSQYSFLGLDPRAMEDKYTYYWTQNVSHTMINRHYCIYEAPEEYKYSESDWGLTACGGCGKNPEYKSREPFKDDGIIAPTAAISAFPYTPFYSTQVLMNLIRNYPKLNGTYGLNISYCPSDKSVGTEYLAMEHAPMAIMMENYRTGLIWKLLMKNEYVQKGLQLAEIRTSPEYTPGFYLATVNTATHVYDMMRHPDREKYEIDFYTKNSGNGLLVLANTKNEEIYRTNIELTAGTNIISFFDNSILRGKKYTLTVTDGANQSYSIPVTLR